MIKVAKIKNGYVRGTAAADSRIISFKGIPYAQPPVGENRWRAPKPCEDWEGIRDCIEFSPISMQSIPGLDKENIYTKEWNVDSEIPMSEDSLYLNVWTPAGTPEDSLPVFVWIHGGALQWGNSAEMEFDGERLARRGIVVVTINYRLNVFGFLAHQDMLNGKGDMNVGNLDQQFALRWTKENIRAFGGNPECITIGGQSAGGGSVVTQLNCAENREYIQGAIIESGIFGQPFKLGFPDSTEEAMEWGKQFLDMLGVSTLDEARKLPACYIRDKNDEFGKLWGTVEDGIFQKDNYQNNISSGMFADVPILTGWTDNEFITEGINAVEVGTRAFCRLLEDNGYKSPHYVYEFGPDIPGEDCPGAFHSSDLWFFFETLAKCWRPFTGKHYDLSRQMCNYWANFIKCGDPNGADCTGLPMEKWASFDSEESNLMFFGNELEEKKKAADSKTCLFLEREKSGYKENER